MSEKMESNHFVNRLPTLNYYPGKVAQCSAINQAGHPQDLICFVKFSFHRQYNPITHKTNSQDFFPYCFFSMFGRFATNYGHCRGAMQKHLQ